MRNVLSIYIYIYCVLTILVRGSNEAEFVSNNNIEYGGKDKGDSNNGYCLNSE